MDHKSNSHNKWAAARERFLRQTQQGLDALAHCPDPRRLLRELIESLREEAARRRDLGSEFRDLASPEESR